MRCPSSAGWWCQVDAYKGYAATPCTKSEARGGNKRRFPPRLGVPRAALHTVNGLPPPNFSRQVFPLRRCQGMTQNLCAVVHGMQELGYRTTRTPWVSGEEGAQHASAGGRGGSKCSSPARLAPVLRMRARVPSSVKDRVPRRGGAGPPRRKGVGWAGPGGGGGGYARARAGANGDRREGRGGPGGGDDGRRLWPRRRAAAGWGLRRAPGAQEARRRPRALPFIGGRTVAPPASFGRARRRCPSWIRCGSGWASTTRRWVRAPVGAGEATRREPGAATGLAGLGPPLPPRAPRGTTKAGAGPATPPPSALGARAPGAAPGPRGQASGRPRTAGQSPSAPRRAGASRAQQPGGRESLLLAALGVRTMILTNCPSQGCEGSFKFCFKSSEVAQVLLPVVGLVKND